HIAHAIVVDDNEERCFANVFLGKEERRPFATEVHNVGERCRNQFASLIINHSERLVTLHDSDFCTGIIRNNRNTAQSAYSYSASGNVIECPMSFLTYKRNGVVPVLHLFKLEAA